MELAAVRARATMLAAIRGWFAANGFVEVETPILFEHAGLNPHIAEFETRFTGALDVNVQRRLWLRTSPEVFHKRLLAAGVPRLYEIGRFFRNGESTDHHNPEFTGLEFYEANADYRRVMEITEQLLSTAIAAVAGGTKIHVAGREIDVAPPWDRITVHEAFRRWAGVTLPKTDDASALAAEARRIGIPVTPDDEFDDVFFRILLEKVDRELGFPKPLFLHDYPASMGVMARLKAGNPDVAERVEAYLGSVELANGFSELTDPAEQRARFVADRERVAASRGVAPESLPLDEGFLEALGRMPPSTGIAIGLDRVLMLAMGKAAIRDVIPFPFRA